MKISVLEEKKNPNFSRTELRFEINHGGGKTPSRQEAISLVSANSGADEDLISIRSVRSVFGQAKSVCHANIYKKRKELEENEPKHILKRGQKKETPKEEAPAEAPAEEAAPTESTEAPKEEKSEEKEGK